MQLSQPPRAVQAVAPLPDRSVGGWFVLHTKSRQERTLSADLAAMCIHHFLPLIPVDRYVGSRKAKAWTPLFPGYVFLRGSLEEAYQADRTKRVARIIRVSDQTRLDAELVNLHRVLVGDGELDPYPFLRSGTRVIVRAGPFRGVQGLVESRVSWNRLILQIDLLGTAVGLQIDASLLDLIE